MAFKRLQTLISDQDEYKEARIALALNGGYVRVEGKKIIASINIKYPQNSFAPLISIKGLGTIGVEEGLFWVLQKVGWLHSGEVEWVTDFKQTRAFR